MASRFRNMVMVALHWLVSFVSFSLVWHSCLGRTGLRLVFCEDYSSGSFRMRHPLVRFRFPICWEIHTPYTADRDWFRSGCLWVYYADLYPWCNSLQWRKDTAPGSTRDHWRSSSRERKRAPGPWSYAIDEKDNYNFFSLFVPWFIRWECHERVVLFVQPVYCLVHEQVHYCRWLLYARVQIYFLWFWMRPSPIPTKRFWLEN